MGGKAAEPGAVEQLQRAGEAWRFARDELRQLPPHALKALAAHEHLDTTAKLVERLADEVAVQTPGEDRPDPA